MLMKRISGQRSIPGWTAMLQNPSTRRDWLRNCLESGCDGFLVRPPNDFPERKAMVDERLTFLARNVGKPVYPGLDELLFYENKRALVNWLDYYEIPHPKTVVLSSYAEAMEFVEGASYPFVSKRAIGSAASGVIVVKSPRQARRLVRQFFGWPIPGITRGKIIEILNSKGITVHEEPIAATDIASFDAAFISGTSPKVLPIAQMDDTTYDVNDPLLRYLMNWYDRTLD